MEIIRKGALEFPSDRIKYPPPNEVQNPRPSLQRKKNRGLVIDPSLPATQTLIRLVTQSFSLSQDCVMSPTGVSVRGYGHRTKR